jgi:M6 family metalloprotease-like protein
MPFNMTQPHFLLQQSVLICSFIMGLWVQGSVYAVPPLKPEFHPGGDTCHVNQEALMRNQLRMKGELPSIMDLPSNLTPDVLVIRVDFSDLAMDLTFAQTETFFERVQDFYSENSYGIFHPTFTITSTVHRLGALATYGGDCSGDVACRAEQLRQDAISAENGEGRDFSLMDQIMIYHAGTGQETTGIANDIWSLYIPDTFVVDFKSFSGFTIVPEKEAANVDPLGVICHEYGHQNGLPDLYDISYAGGQPTVGSWDVMDFPYSAAPGGALGSNPPHLGAWSKTFMGFITPTELSSGGTLSLPSVEESSGIIKIPIEVSDLGSGNEFFLVEYRNKASAATYDKGIPASGLLIWHIDDTIASSANHLTRNDLNTVRYSGADHKAVDLVEADGTELYSSLVPGEATDAFGASNSFLSPFSDAFNGLPSGISILGISGIETANASFTLDFSTISSLQTSGTNVVSLDVNTSYGYVGTQVPPQSFADGTSLLIIPLSESSVDGLPETSYASQLSASNAGVILGTRNQAQPASPFLLKFGFASHPTLSNLTAAEMEQLVIARYESGSGAWVPIDSQVSASNYLISAYINHLSIFQVMQATPGTSPESVIIYPNPMRPHLGTTYAHMNFSNLPANSKIRLFTVRGHLLRELHSDGTGLAVWDGLNQSGQKAASGVYLAVIEDASGGHQKIFKVAVER